MFESHSQVISFIQTYHVLNDAALVNLGDIFGCFWTNLVYVGQQSHLVNT